MKAITISKVVAAGAAGLLVCLGAVGSAADKSQPLTPQQAAELKQMILPQPGENRFWEIAWLNDIWQARQQAAAEGKPIFVWSGSEGAPITNC